MAAAEELTLPSDGLAALAREAGFDLVGFARATPIAPEVLGDWLAAGHHADMDWLAERVAARLDVGALLPGAQTVVALACNYWRTDAASPVARYARGRDYHLTLRDRLRALRRGLRQRFPGVADYGSVDTNPVMEKVWAARAGLGFVGKNACFITPQFGSWVLLATLILDRPVDRYAEGPTADVCGRCSLCLTACPTGALVAERVVDARRCLSYQTIENEGPAPEALRPAYQQLVFGCDVCQDVCPLNVTPVLAQDRFAPRPVAGLSVRELAALSKDAYAQLTPGTPLARAGYDGLRRNAAYALGAMGDRDATALLERLAGDESAVVAEAARWALGRLA